MERLDLNPELGILFIVVDPPKFGTPPYYCRKNGEDLKDVQYMFGLRVKQDLQILETWRCFITEHRFILYLN